jgi:putative NADH-flavin reductase
MKLAIFGATGKTGKHVVAQALAAGHEVVALAREPSKLSQAHEHLKVTQGDVRDAAKVESVVVGCDAVISVLGPTTNAPDFQVTTGTQNILAAMQQHGVRRLVIAAGAGVRDPNDQPKLIDKFFGGLVKLLSRNAYEDMVRVVALVRASDVDWTVVRVPRLLDTPAQGNVRVGYVGKDSGTQLSRAAMASFMLKQVSDATYWRQAPMISA